MFRSEVITSPILHRTTNSEATTVKMLNLIIRLVLKSKSAREITVARSFELICQFGSDGNHGNYGYYGNHGN